MHTELDEGRERPENEYFTLRSFLIAFVTVTAVVLVVMLAAYQTCAFEGCPDVDEVRGYVPDEASILVDRDGEEISRLFQVNREMIELESLPEHVTQAFIAIEDQRFYGHEGVDWPRVLGAAWENIRSGGIAEGFSTITMQVARNVFPERLPIQEQTLNRKISEVKVARQIEDRYSKDEILELYLNQIYFGSGAWGIQAAAKEYFGKPATELTVGEAALLAGLPKAPSRLNPRENMDGALERRRLVLRRMRDQGYITAEQAKEAGEAEPELARSRLESADRAAYFVEHVRQIVEEHLGNAVYTQGYTIHTTLDLDAQTVVERELREQLQAIESGRYGYFPHTSFAAATEDNGSNGGKGEQTPYLQGAALVMSVETGDVLAMVGGREFDQSKFNRAVQAHRQPGSAFKPFVYAAALQAGYPPNMILEDTPYRVVQDGRAWEPKNYGGSYSGEVTMRQALIQSKNVATIRLAEQVGLDRVISTARSLGISSDLPRYPSIAIGAAEVTLEELVAAYAALASLGTRPEPRYVTHVTDRNGAVVWRDAPETRRVLDSDVAFLTVDLMQDVVNRGTGAAVRSAGFRAPAAGKTGTTNESADVWFVGFTPRIAAGVWIGMDDPERIMPQATGGRLAAPVWGRIMRSVGEGSGGWEPPPGVERFQVDEMGNVVSSGCPAYGSVREEYFLRGTVNPYDCRQYSDWYGDSLYGDSAQRAGETDESWWRRLRDRVFGDEEPDTVGRTQPDTMMMRPPPRDTLRLDPRPQPRDTIRMPSRDTVRRDTGPIGEPVRDTTRQRPRRDTIPPDTGSAGAIPLR